MRFPLVLRPSLGLSTNTAHTLLLRLSHWALRRVLGEDSGELGQRRVLPNLVINGQKFSRLSNWDKIFIAIAGPEQFCLIILTFAVISMIGS